MILEQDPVTGYWTHVENEVGLRLSVHAPHECKGRLCDVHNRRGEGPQATWPLNWRGDRGMMEVICPHGIGHPTPAQCEYWARTGASGAEWIHGCCGECCSGWMQNE